MTRMGDIQAIYTTNAQMSSFYADEMNVFNVKAYGAVGDGATDDILKINDCIADLKAYGGGVLEFPYGTYLVSSAPVIDFSNVLIRGNFSTIKLTSDTNSNVLDITGVVSSRISNIKIENLIIQGNKGNNALVASDYRGLNLLYVDKMTIDFCRVDDIHCSNIGAGALVIRACTNITVYKTDIDNCGSNGIFGNNGNDNIKITSCKVTNIDAQNGMYFSSDNKNIYVIDCDTDEIADGALEFGSNEITKLVGDDYAYNCYAINNRFKSANGIFISGVYNCYFQNNKVVSIDSGNIMNISSDAQNAYINKNTFIQNNNDGLNTVIQLKEATSGIQTRNIFIEDNHFIFKHIGIDVDSADVNDLFIENNYFYPQYWILQSDLTTVTTEFYINAHEDFTIEANDKIKIGTEIMTVTDVGSTGSSGILLTVTRSVTPKEHSTNDLVHYYKSDGCIGIYFSTSSTHKISIKNNKFKHIVKGIYTGSTITLDGCDISFNDFYDVKDGIEMANVTFQDGDLCFNTFRPYDLSITDSTGIVFSVIRRSRNHGNMFYGATVLNNSIYAGTISSCTFGGAIPTSGYWTANDIIWNRNASASGNIGWVATTSGGAYKEAWDAGNAYITGEWVSYGGKVYEALQDSTNKQPDTETTYWSERSSALAVFKTFGTISD